MKGKSQQEQSWQINNQEIKSWNKGYVKNILTRRKERQYFDHEIQENKYKSLYQESETSNEDSSKPK